MFFDTSLMSVFWDFVTQSFLTEFSVILAFILIVTGLLRLLKQPLIIGYLLAGVIVGPGLLDVVLHEETVDFFARMGIGLLLFMVGLGLSPNAIKGHGKVALRAGIFQILVSIVLGFLASWVLGFDTITSLYVGGAIAFSSTIVIVKLLSDKEEEDSLHGKLAIGILIVQDLVVMLLLMVSSLSSQMGTGDWWVMLMMGVVLLVWLYFFTRFVLPSLMDRMASSSELLLLFALGRCFLIGSLFEYVGFSMEIGTLLAGMTLAMSPYRLEIVHKLTPLRDFFLVLFFVVIGMQLEFSDLVGHWGFFFVILLIVVVGKPLMVYTISRFLGYTPLISAKTGLSLGQVSEFSLLLVSLGISYGHINNVSLLSVMMLVGLVSICLSTYTTIYNVGFTSYLARLGLFDFCLKQEEDNNDDGEQVDVVLYGYGRLGSHLASVFEIHKVAYLVVDHDPTVTRKLKKQKKNVVFSEADNLDAYKRYLHSGAKMCVSTLRSLDDNLTVVESVKAIDDKILVIVVAHDLDEAVVLYKKGADYVIMPHRLSAHHTSVLLEELGFDIDKFVLKKLDHMKELGFSG